MKKLVLVIILAAFIRNAAFSAMQLKKTLCN